MKIRRANAGDLARIREIEVAAGSRFVDVGMPEVAATPPTGMAALHEALETGLLWVAEDPGSGAVGFALVRRLRASAHLEELSVLPASGGRGVGTALVRHAARAASELGCTALTLSTFVRVRWNAPFYERLGFRIVPESELSQEMAALRAREVEAGFPIGQRVIMSLSLVPAGGGHGLRDDSPAS